MRPLTTISDSFDCMVGLAVMAYQTTITRMLTASSKLTWAYDESLRTAIATLFFKFIVKSNLLKPRRCARTLYAEALRQPPHRRSGCHFHSAVAAKTNAICVRDNQTLSAAISEIANSSRRSIIRAEALCAHTTRW